MILAVALIGCSSTPTREEKATKVLMIGNSFSISVMSHLPEVAAAAGVDLDIASLYIGGCSLKRHWENVEKDDEEDFAPYIFSRSCLGRGYKSKSNLCAVLRMQDWDIVTIQQASRDSWKGETYEPYGTKLIAKIRELAPKAKIYVQETWSYTPWDKRLEKWGIDQNEMYARLHDAYGKFAAHHGLKVIPFGTSVQQWRRRLPVKYGENSFGGDVVGGGHQEERDHFKRDASYRWVPNCDVCHLGRKGEYFQALVWAATLFDADLTELEYKPAFVTDDDLKLMKEIAMGLK